MLDVRRMLRARALAHAPLVALIAQRIYYVRPQVSPVYPLITYRLYAATMEDDVPLRQETFEFEVHDNNPDRMIQTGEELQKALHKQAMVVPNGSGYFMGSFFETAVETFDEATGVFKKTMRFRVFYYTS